MTIIIGVDPGLGGAIAAVSADDRAIYLGSTPTVEVTVQRKRRVLTPDGLKETHYAKGLKRRYEVAAMRGMLTALREKYEVARVVIEEVGARPGEGVTSSFTFGMGLGLWVGLVTGLSLSHALVRPVTWKRRLGVPADKQAARLMALERWPNLAAELSRKKDEARAEALFLAAWGWVDRA